MTKIHILCIEDEPDVLDAIIRDLASFEEHFPITGTPSAEEAQAVIASIEAKGERIGLIFCDHIMPGLRGIDLMTQLKEQPLQSVNGTKKVLFTGQAGHEDTIQAINQAAIDHYLAKPWTQPELEKITRKLLTDYVIETGLPPLSYLSILDAERLASAIHDRGEMNETG